ncbi:MAG TPA: PLP-dependent aminotransferase family protein [Ktedonosporobacter sp.]|nr:PLP-dependent aminotransferase family protein [Ktedonosporobacter sp.]
MQINWDQRFARRTQRMRSSAIRELLKATEQPDTISFAGGLPAPEIFPIEKIATTTQRILQTAGPQALQYSATEGYRPLRELIARLLSQPGLEITIDNVLVTSGSQQGLDLLGKVLIDPGDHILVESPTYMGMFQSWNTYEPEYVALPSDGDGLITASGALEKALQLHPKFLYVLPNFQNPTGITLTLERRQQLLELARRYDVPIVEDDPYSQLRYSGEPLPSLISLAGRTQRAESDKAGPYDGNVIYLGTFSKVLAPGLRLGWVVAPPTLIRKLVQAKQGDDLHAPTFSQMIAYEIVREGFLEEHVPLLCQTYRERRDIMLAEMEEYFPENTYWTRPDGGMFLWVTLPEGMDAVEVLKEASAQRVTFVPGARFHADDRGANTFRLSFSNPSPEKIREGIARLGRVLHKMRT